MGIRLDLTGHVFGRLTVLHHAGVNKFGHTLLACRCECGETTNKLQACLRNGMTKSCGCLRREQGHERVASGVFGVTKHGKWKSTEYRLWIGILDRCRNPNSKDFVNYGGRGILVDERWLSFECFLADMGERPTPSHSIDRINNDGPYSKENCKWASRKDQQRNRRCNHMVTLRGETKVLAQWADDLGMSWATLAQRIKLGWSEEKILSTPQRLYRR